MEINVREARRKLCALLDKVHDGESVTLTRRGEPMARLVPPEESPKRLPSLEQFRATLRVSGESVSALLNREREEGRF